MEPAAAMGHSCQRRALTESESNPRLPEKRQEKKIFKPPAEQKRNRFENYVDSPLCRGASTHLVLQSGFTG